MSDLHDDRASRMTEQDLERGRLSQRCPECGLEEAAGFYCTRCCVDTGNVTWFRPTASASRKASLERAWAKRREGR